MEYKKLRARSKLFLAEGNKLVKDIIKSGIQTDTIIATTDFLDQVKSLSGNAVTLIEASENEIAKVSFLKHPPQALALCRLPEYHLPEPETIQGLTLCLDSVQDPGNLGTIVRLAAWMGIDHIICSKETADVFSPKVVQATMGAICHVKVHYTCLEEYLSGAVASGAEVMGATLEGENIFTARLPEKGFLVMGNEGNGINGQLLGQITKRLSIPAFASEHVQVESLNVAIATAIICSEFRRRQLFPSNHSK